MQFIISSEVYFSVTKNIANLIQLLFVHLGQLLFMVQY